MTLPENVVISRRLSRWRKEIISYSIGVISDSSGKDCVTRDEGQFVIDQEFYAKMDNWNRIGVDTLNLWNVTNNRGIEDARIMTADEIQVYVKNEHDEEIKWDNIPLATEEEIEEHLTRTNRQDLLEDMLQDLYNGNSVKIDHDKKAMQVRYHNRR